MQACMFYLITVKESFERNFMKFYKSYRRCKRIYLCNINNFFVIDKFGVILVRIQRKKFHVNVS